MAAKYLPKSTSKLFVPECYCYNVTYINVLFTIKYPHFWHLQAKRYPTLDFTPPPPSKIDVAPIHQWQTVLGKYLPKSTSKPSVAKCHSKQYINVLLTITPIFHHRQSWGGGIPSQINLSPNTTQSSSLTPL